MTTGMIRIGIWEEGKRIRWISEIDPNQTSDEKKDFSDAPPPCDDNSRPEYNYIEDGQVY